MKYVYVINLDERGEFYADVRKGGEQGKTVFEIRSDEETGEVSLIEDGFMKHKKDLRGLAAYMADLKIMKPGDRLEGIF